MTIAARRPSISDRKPVYRRVLCNGKCNHVAAFKLTSAYRWTCQECGYTFTQRPWVSDEHPLIEAPRPEGKTKCQRNAPIAEEIKIAQTAEGMRFALSATETTPTAQTVAVLESVHRAAILDCAKSATARANSATIETTYRLALEL